MSYQRMPPETAIRRARNGLRLKREPRDDGSVCWMVYDRKGNGRGIRGDQAAGQDEYEKQVMFRALALIDPGHDWHEYDWHLLTGPAEERVHTLIERCSECDAAERDCAAIRALVHLVCRNAT